MNLLGRRVLVTGGAGFLGRHVVQRLQAAGATLSLPRRTECDLRVERAVRDLFLDVQPELVVHLAARVGGIAANQAEPGGFLFDNLMMGLLVMREAQAAGVRKFVTVGTVCAYPNYAPVPFRETDLWAGYPEQTNAPYGLAKKMLLVLGQAYRRQYGFDAIYLLPANLYGPGDNFDLERSHVIPALIRKCVEARAAGARTVTVWGTGRATREFLYVEDCADAIVRAARDYDDPEPMNLGTGREVGIGVLAALIVKLTGFQGGLQWDTRRPDGQPRRSLDCSRAAVKLGWAATTPLEEGLRRTIAWYEQTRTRATAA